MSKRRKIWLWILGCLFVIVAVPLVRFAIKAREDEAAFQEQLRLARAEGLPATAAEFAATIRPAKPEENAAPLYRKLRGRVSSLGDIMQQTSWLSYEPNPSRIAEAKKKLAENAEAIDVIDQAARLPRCWFDRDWSGGHAVLFPEYADIKNAARLLALRGAVAAAEGRIEDAVRETRTMRVLAGHVREEPTAIGRLVADSIDYMALQNLSAWSLRHRDPAFTKELEGALAAMPQPNLKEEFSGELFMLLILIELADSQEGREKLGLREEDQPGPLMAIFPLLMDRGKARVDIVKWQRAWWAALEAPYPDREQKMNAAIHEQMKAMLAFPTAAIILEKLGGGTDTFAHREERWQSRKLQYQALVRALGNAKIPRSIRTDDLLSPFDGSPLKYSFDGNQIVIEVATPSDSEFGPSPLKVPPDSVVGKGD